MGTSHKKNTHTTTTKLLEHFLGHSPGHVLLTALPRDRAWPWNTHTHAYHNPCTHAQHTTPHHTTSTPDIHHRKHHHTIPDVFQSSAKERSLSRRFASIKQSSAILMPPKHKSSEHNSSRHQNGGNTTGLNQHGVQHGGVQPWSCRW